MWANWQTQGALSVVKTVGSYIAASRQASSDRAWQKYNNQMTRLQNANNQNNLTENENMLIERTSREAYNIRVSEYKTEASADVASGAIGAEGNSVNLVMKDIQRNAAKAHSALTTDFNYSVESIRNQQEQSAFQTELQLDKKSIPSPSIATSLLGSVADVTSEYLGSKFGTGKYATRS